MSKGWFNVKNKCRWLSDQNTCPEGNTIHHNTTLHCSVVPVTIKKNIRLLTVTTKFQVSMECTNSFHVKHSLAVDDLSSPRQIPFVAFPVHFVALNFRQLFLNSCSPHFSLERTRMVSDCFTGNRDSKIILVLYDSSIKRKQNN